MGCGRVVGLNLWFLVGLVWLTAPALLLNLLRFDGYRSKGAGMNLLLRFVRFFTHRVLVLMIRLLIEISRLLLPLLLRVIRWIFSLMRFSLTAAVNNPRQFSERLASEWTRQLLTLGVSRDYLNQLYSLCRFLAVSMIVLGWVVTTLFTVAILRVVFGLFI